MPTTAVIEFTHIPFLECPVPKSVSGQSSYNIKQIKKKIHGRENRFFFLFIFLHIYILIITIKLQK